MDNQQKKNLSDQDVTKYTAGLWKYKAIPSQKTVPEPAPEHLRDNHTLGNFQVIAARVRGKKHKHDGSNCDDWFETENIDGIFVSAVSDGAGSKKFSRIGAATACKTTIFFLKVNLEKLLKSYPTLRENLSHSMTNQNFSEAAGLLANLVQDSILAARESVVGAYESRRGYARYTTVVGRELELRDFACTLLVTVAVPLETTGETLIVACQVGDGIIAALNTTESFDKAVTLLGIPDSGKFSGETDFLTSSKFAVKNNLALRTKLSRKPIDLIFSMTDGVADDYDPNELHMRRLYFDLLINRVLPFPQDIDQPDENEPPIVVPDPQAYPRLDGNETGELVPIQYTDELCTACNLSLEQLWKDCTPLKAMARKIPLNRDRSPALRLQEWLDNYTIRGSFDDRTLVILRKGGDDRGR